MLSGLEKDRVSKVINVKVNKLNGTINKQVNKIEQYFKELKDYKTVITNEINAINSGSNISNNWVVASIVCCALSAITFVISIIILMRRNNTAYKKNQNNNRRELDSLGTYLQLS